MFNMLPQDDVKRALLNHDVNEAVDRLICQAAVNAEYEVVIFLTIRYSYLRIHIVIDISNLFLPICQCQCQLIKCYIPCFLYGQGS